MDLYIDEHTHHIYSFGQSSFILLVSCMKVTYDNYNTTRINETFIKNFFATILQLLHWMFVQLPNFEL
jgi:hypothetical protein